MSLSAISVLPSVHASFVGIILAFFTAYVFYVYQKIKAIEDNLDKLIIEQSSHGHQLDDSELKFNMNYIEYCTDEIKRINLSSTVNNYMSEQDILDQLDHMYEAFRLFNTVIIGTFDKFGFKPKIESFDIKNYKENYDEYRKIYGIVKYYNNFHLQQIIKKHKLMNDLLVHKIEERLSKELDTDFKKLGYSLTEQNFKEQLEHRMKIELNNHNFKDQGALGNFQSNLKEYFNFYNNDYKNIQKLISEVERTYSKHDLYKISRNVFGFFIIILIMGILIPILMMAKEDCLKGSLIVSWISQFIWSILSFLPYIFVCLNSLIKLKKD